MAAVLALKALALIDHIYSNLSSWKEALVLDEEKIGRTHFLFITLKKH